MQRAYKFTLSSVNRGTPFLCVCVCVCVCEPGLSYSALLPPDATNFETEYPITIFMYIFIMYFYNISLILQPRFIIIF